MRALASLLTAALFAGFAVGPAAAQERNVPLDIGGTSIKLVLPAAFCSLDPAQQSDARMLRLVRQAQAGKNIVLTQYANCEQLKAWRTGQRKVLDDLGGATTPTQYANQSLPYTRPQLIAQLSAVYKRQGGSILQGATSEINRKIGAAARNLKINETKFLGVMAENAKAIYIGLLQKLNTEFGDPKVQIGVTGVTIIKGKLLSISVYTPSIGENSADEALQTAQSIIEKTIAANGG